MPTYEYACTVCGLRFERNQKFGAEPAAECPECHGPVRRLISRGTSFVVKGAGPSPSPGSSRGCSLEQSGQTCCGRGERCGKPPCGEGK